MLCILGEGLRLSQSLHGGLKNRWSVRFCGFSFPGVALVLEGDQLWFQNSFILHPQLNHSVEEPPEQVEDSWMKVLTALRVTISNNARIASFVPATLLYCSPFGGFT